MHEHTRLYVDILLFYSSPDICNISVYMFFAFRFVHLFVHLFLFYFILFIHLFMPVCLVVDRSCVWDGLLLLGVQDCFTSEKLFIFLANFVFVSYCIYILYWDCKGG